MKLIDIGVNLLHRSFDADRAAVVERARAAGVSVLILTGTSEVTSRKAADLAAQHPGAMFATAGVHPHDAKHFTPRTIKALEELAARPETTAVGECGLDFNRDFSPRPAQERAFEAQLDLAGRVGKPLFLHERDAHERFLAILKAHRGRWTGAVAHCFTGTADEAKQYLDLGLFIGITGWICDERRGRHLADVVKRVPLDRLMLETDAPFLVPRTAFLRNAFPGRPSRNEPAYLTEVLAAVARAMGRSEEEVAAATTRNAREFFGLPLA